MDLSLNDLKLKHGIAITGGIGTGKSTVARYIESQGYLVIDADQVNRDLLRPGSEAVREIGRDLGSRFVASDGVLKKDELKAAVFQDDSLRKRLEGIVHPKIQKQTECILREKGLFETPSLWFYEAALILENNLQKGFKEVWVTRCRIDQQLERVGRRDDLDHSFIQKIIDKQMPSDRKAMLATHVVDTSSDLNSVYQRVNQLIQQTSRERKENEL